MAIGTDERDLPEGPRTVSKDDVPVTHSPAGPIDLAEVAAESPAESIALENEIVEHIAHEDGFPERPAEHSIAEQLQGLVDPDEIRRH